MKMSNEITKKEIKTYAKVHKCSIREAQRQLGLDATGQLPIGNISVIETLRRELNMKKKFCSLKELGRLNQISMDKGYNRNLYFENFAKDFEGKMKDKGMWNGADNTYVILCGLMFHNHKGGVECETHIRTEVFTDGLVGSFLTLDIPIREFDSLADTDTVKLKECA